MLREIAEDAVKAEVQQAERYSHQRNYYKLHVRRDGTVNWFESINKSDDLIDGQADRFAAIPSVITRGTGGYACNCDYCEAVFDAADAARAEEQGREYNRDEKFDSKYDAVYAAVGDADLDSLEAEMLKEFAEIPEGYFEDEEIATVGV